MATNQDKSLEDIEDELIGILAFPAGKLPKFPTGEIIEEIPTSDQTQDAKD